jgi:uncharacterized protein
MDQRFQTIQEIVAKELNQGKDAAHDIDHILRVYNLALTIAKEEEGVDSEVLQAAVLLHDIGAAQEAEDASGRIDHAVIGAEMAGPILRAAGFSTEKIRHVQDCILSHRYRNDCQPATIEAKILYDADKLETVGAVGIARSFAWIGKYQAKIYKPIDNLEDYIKENLIGGKMNGRIIDKSKHSVQINYAVKDRFLLDGLYTTTAKKIGRSRLAYYKEFLDRLEKEVNGEL